MLHVRGAAFRRGIASAAFMDRLWGGARERPQRIVLPEGEDARVVDAACRIQREGLADVTILGDVDVVHAHVKAAGAKLPEGLAVLDPRQEDPRRVEGYAEDMLAARRGKAGDHETLEAACAALQSDAPLYATMMVRSGDQDGMVSGACHTSADTIRPALRLLGSVENQIVSSLMFMLLKERVVVYADCALQVAPDATQLGQIAAQSANTAAEFGVDPAIALLSFATGKSNDGPMVAHTREATRVASSLLTTHELSGAPPIYGPVQYDAAVNPSIGKSKGCPLAADGATVLVFPDLNCGNITYKAVQQSTGCVVLGPILQGLTRPVNDLSRGSSVADIVNTVAVTAVQAIARQLRGGGGAAPPAPCLKAGRRF
eukprot:TRINITY_DN5651_c0_g2_i1.p1 TRINITY_DN5651_c0_g2~~TRINITY_DN5651_c0_g2_i1.p1  ORF type:complete len:373 (+),score=123.19 TRINITY_DN5651_c0_g2_i1:90-1208(+)